MKKKTARRWLNKNSWKIAQLRTEGGYMGHSENSFTRQFHKCIKEVRKNG